jgi:[ribosomal protein S18]-alanine N-acetyltransferase
MSEPMVIRAMSGADIERVMGIAAGLETAPHWPREAYEVALEASAAPLRIALVAENRGQVIGFAIASVVPPEAELETIAVSAGHQGGGSGEALLSALLGRLRSRGVQEVRLEVRASNLAAQSFYRAHSFAEFARREKYYADTGEGAIVMRARIPISPKRE